MNSDLPTPRLILRPLTLDEARAVVSGDRAGRSWSAGYPAEGDVEIARLVLQHPPHTEREILFGTRQIIDRESGLVIGALGFFGPPDADGQVELGYGVVPEARGVGIATEAVGALLAFADAQPDVSRVVASAELMNRPSLRVLEKNGLEPTGEDGDLRHYARATRAAARKGSN